MRDTGLAIPPARSLEAIQADAEWAEGRDIDWSKVVISLIKPGPAIGLQGREQ
jgi:hypothetical protein